MRYDDMIPDIIIYNEFSVRDLLRVLLILAVAIFIAKGITINLKRVLKDRLSQDHVEIINKVIYGGILTIAFLTVLPVFGINLSGILVAGGIAGIVLGIASQSVLGNLMAGFFLVIERPMKIGQAVSIAGTVGVVEDIRILSTTIRTFEGLYVRIPNEKVFTTEITNYVEHVARRFDYRVGIRYSDDADKAIRIIQQLYDEHPLVLKSPAPDIFVDNLGDNAVELIVRTWAPSKEWYGVRKELLWKIKTALEEQGIEIAFPQRTVWFANELQKREIREGTDAFEAR